MWIVSHDSVFAQALQIALREGGVEAEILSTLPVRIPDSNGWIIDLESIPMLSSLPSPAVTFARSSATHPTADFIRPFLFRELVAMVKERFTLWAPTSVREQPVSDAPFLKLLPDGVQMNGQTIALSPSERALLELLMQTPGECVSTERIDELWQEKGGNTTAVYIRYLRKKLDEPSGLRLIRSIRGRGYCLCLPN